MESYTIDVTVSKASVSAYAGDLVTVNLVDVSPTDIIEEIGLANLLEEVSLEDLEEIVNLKRLDEEAYNDQLRDKATRG